MMVDTSYFIGKLEGRKPLLLILHDYLLDLSKFHSQNK